MTLIREALTDLNNLTRLTDISIVDDMVNYYRRRTDKTTVRTAIKNRYGYGIKKVDDGVESGTTIETYAREGFTEQVDEGLIEAISSGFGPKIVNALATLFTERTQKYTYNHENEDTDTEPAEDLLNKHRDYGGYNSTLTAADKLSIQAGSSAVYISWARDHLRYQKFSPADISVFYSDYITEDGETRLVDQSDLNDATAVRIRLSQVDATTWNFLLIMGRSDIWPMGRQVTYQSDETGGELPEVGAEGVFDWYPEGGSEVANPLSYYAEQNPDESYPEYPLAILYGGTTDSGDTLPITTSLYNDCVEIDLAASHILSTSQEAAAGTLVIERSETGRNKNLPTQLTGKFALDQGQKVLRVDSNSQASLDAIQALKDLQVQIASGYGVPDYMAVSEDHMLEAASGISLQIKTKPLKQARTNRIELNQPFIRDIFAIEKILIELHSEENSTPEFALLKELEQVWDAGELEIPENKKEKTERNIAAKEAGGIDEIEFIRRENNFVTDEEAINFYRKMAERKAEFPPLNQEEEKPKSVGLPLRGQANNLQ